MEYIVSVIGIGRLSPGKGHVSVGSELRFEKEKTNPVDEHAIKVTFNGFDVGYVGNSADTKGDYSASEIYELMEDVAIGIVVEESVVKFKTRDSKAFLVKLNIKEEIKKEEVPKMDEVFKFVLAGGMTGTYKIGKRLLLDDVMKGISATIKLEISGDKIEAIYSGEICGFVEAKFADKLKAILPTGTEALAVVTGVVGTNFNCEFKVSKDILVREEKAKSLKAIVKWIVSEGLDTKENVEDKVAYMLKCNVTEGVMADVFKSYAHYPAEVKGKIPKKPKTLFQDNSKLVSKTIAYILVNRNLNFEGDKGVGKNVLAETLAWVFKRPLYEFSLNSQHDNSSLLGGNTFAESMDEPKEESLNFAKGFLGIVKGMFGVKKDSLDVEEFSGIFKKLVSYFTGKKLKFEKSAIIEAAEYGGILVLDEFNMALPHVMAIFNSILDDRRRINVSGYKAFDAHMNFIAIATQNVGYRGTFAINEATSERFVPITFPQMDSIQEVLFAKIPHLSIEMATKCQMVFAGIQLAVSRNEIEPSALTIRGFIDACLVTEYGVPLKDALIDNIANRVADSADRAIVIQRIDAIVL